MRDFKLGKIYKLHILGNENLIYYGSTIQSLSARLAGHRRHFKSWKNGKGRYITSFKLLECENVVITLVENYPCETKYELEARERFWIENNNCVNKCIPTRTTKEWNLANASKIKEYQQNYRKTDKCKQCKKKYMKTNKFKEYMKKYNKTDKFKEYQKKHYEANKNKIAKQGKKYREKNKEVIAKRKKEYYKKNKEAILQKQKERYEKNKEAILQKQKQYRSEKIKCPFCCCSVRKDSLKRHQKSKKCKKFQNNI